MNSTIFLGGGNLSQSRIDEAGALAGYIAENYASPALYRADMEAEFAAQVDAIMPRAARGMNRGWNLDIAPELGIKLDSAGSNVSSGVFGARSLEAVLSRTNERKSRLTSEEIFGLDGSVGAGAQSYRMERTFGYGMAGFHKGSAADVPRNEVSVAQSSFPVRTIVSMFSTDIFELQAASYAGFGLHERKMRQTKRSVDEMLNKVAWFGSAGQGLNGALSFPWTPKYVSPVSMANADITPDNADAILAELCFIAQYAGNMSDDAFEPTDIVFPTTLYNKLISTRVGTREITIMNQFLETNGYIDDISRVHKAGELKNAGGPKVDAIYTFRKEPESGRIILPQNFTMLPPQLNGFNVDILCYARTGGFAAEAPGNDLVAYVTR